MISCPDMQPATYLGVVLFNYRLVKKLGSGGFGDVYLAEHVDLGRRAACKILHSQFAHNHALVERFFREAKAVCAIGHPAIIDVQNFGRLPTGEPFYLMDYFSGENLSQYIARIGPIPLAQIPLIFDPMASALAAAHAKGIIHRDLKPDNIMLREENGQIVEVKLVDFGIAKLMDEQVSSHTQTGTGMGTPRFMAPEQARDAKHADARSDVYSLAATIYTAIAGQPPFTQENVTDVVIAVQTQPPTPLRQVAPHAPLMLEQLLAQCMAKAPGDRPASIGEAWSRMRDALGGYRRMDSAPVGHLPVTMAEPYHRPGLPMANSTLGLAGSEVHRQHSSAALRWPWIAAGIGLVGVGIAAVFLVKTIATGNSTSQITMPAGADVMQPATVGMVTTDDLDAATSPPVDASSDGPVHVAEVPDEALDCTESSFTALYESKLTRTQQRQTIERLDACLGADEISKELHEQVQSRLSSRRRLTRSPPKSPSPKKPHARDCSTGSFERVYKQASPSGEEIKSALTRLKQCRKDNALDAATYERIQKALIRKL
jgi:serine/threonine protein kinase